MKELTQVFKALSEPVRLRIVRLLLDHGTEAYGEELAGALGIPAYQVSRHLKVLKTTGLVNERRQGRWVYYSLAKDNGNGQLLTSMRRIIASASMPPVNGRGHGAGSRRRRRTAPRRRKVKEFNWNQGPAIPGIL